MKKLIFLSLALLCLFTNLKAQTEIITFPTPGSVFQANSAGFYNLTFGGQVKNPFGLFYSIQKRNGDNTWVEEVSNQSITTSFDATSIGSGGPINRGLFNVNSTFNLTKGWYRVSIYYKFIFSNKKYVRHFVEFGVGDVYFIAGQSNAAGYGGEEYNLQNQIPSVRDNTISTIMNNDNASPMARVLDLKIDEQMSQAGINNPQKEIRMAIPYNVNGLGGLDRFNEFKNGTIAIPFDLNQRVGIYPNGYNSWNWAPLAHKFANPDNSHKYSGTPTLWFNCASPASMLQDVPNNALNSWSKNIINSNAPSTSLAGKFKQTLETYSGIFGAKAVLWHQGESDHEYMLNSSTNQNLVTPNNYRNKLDQLIDFSRTAAGANASNSNSILPWYIANVSYMPNSSTSNVQYSIASTLQGLTSSYYNGANSTNKAFVSSTNFQISTRPNIYAGPNTDLIDNSSGMSRSSKYLIHFNGSTLQTVAVGWYNAITLNATNNVLAPVTPIKIASVSKSSNNLYKVFVDNTSLQSTEFVWLADNGGLNYNMATTTIPSYEFPALASNTPGTFLHGLVKQNNRWYPIIPFMIPGGVRETKRLAFKALSSYPQSSNNRVRAQVEAVDVQWEVINSTVPSWIILDYNETDSEVLFNLSSNSSGSERIAYVKIQESGNTSLFSTIEIRQPSNNNPPTGNDINLITLPIASSYGARYVNQAINGGGFLISGQPYSNGFGVHANNGITFNLNGQYNNFSGKVGRDDSVDPNTGSNFVGQVQFKIKINGSVIWTSMVHNSITNAECFNIPLAGVNTLELVTEIVENDYFDHADWVDLKLNSSLYPVSCSTCQNSFATNTAAIPANLPSSGGSSTLSATCPANTNFLWQTGATSSSILISTTVSTSYWVKCVGNNCSDSDLKYINVNVTPPSGCANLGDGTIAGYWMPENTNFPLVVRDFNGSKWLTQRIGTNPDAFLVRGHNMIYRSDITSLNTSVSSQPSCFSWATSAFGGLMPPSESEFQIPYGYALNWECTSGTTPCTASNGTPIYIQGGSPPPPPPPTGGCSGTFYLNNSWTYAGGVTTSPVVGGNTVGGNMIMGGVNYTTEFPGKGLGMHANSEVIYDLGANHGFTTFRALCGKDDGNFCSASWAGHEKITFKIVNNSSGIDISQVTVGNPNTNINQTAELIADITGVRYIKLVASDGGDGNFCDWANWANARVLCTSSARQGVDEEIEEIEESVLILPNPNRGDFESLIMLNSSSDLELSLINNLGQVFEAKKVEGVKGANKVQFKVSNLAKGVYTLRVQTNSKVLSSKVVIE